MLEDSIHDLPRPVDDGEDTIGQSRFGEKLAQPHRAHRRPLRRLEYVGVAGPYSHRQGPQRHHAREVEWGYGRNHPERIGPGGERFPCLPYGAVDVISRREGRLCDDLSGGRIVDGFRVTSVSLLPPSPYKVPDFQAFLTRLHLVLLTGPACRMLRGSCGRGRRGRSSGWRESLSPRQASPGTLPSVSPSPP